MEVKATAKTIKIAPRKVRLLAGLIRGLNVDKAGDQLRFTGKKAAMPMSKLLDSAIANAENNFELDRNNLFVKEVRVNSGVTMKRWAPKARGRATPLRKRTSHIYITLGELVDSGFVKAKNAKIDAPIKLESRIKEAEGVKIKDKKIEETPDMKSEGKAKKIVDPRGEGRGKNTKIEGQGGKGFASRIFRRKSG